MKTMIEILVKRLNEKLEKSVLNGRVLLSGFRFLEEKARSTTAYVDPSYMPFYYYLGTEINPKSVLEIGFGLGLSSGCFFKGCTSVENFVAFEEKKDVYYSINLAKRNIKDVYKQNIFVHYGKIDDEGFVNGINCNKFELIIINQDINYDKAIGYFNFVWNYVKDDGIVVVDFVDRNEGVKKSVADFCKSKNRQYYNINTRYGVALFQK